MNYILNIYIENYNHSGDYVKTSIWKEEQQQQQTNKQKIEPNLRYIHYWYGLDP